ncbi:MFS transporter [Haloarcula litorea]|uniref:MFS transporter n=1 Tax=Haloarcula litorea TaxID=3032579 RepID=UPI0023E887F1|nr:MFS transporter [Halomicroarcula sp. GDY20]
MARVGGSLALLRDREFAALAGTAFARAQSYSTILIALALYAELYDTVGVVEGLFGTAFALAQLLVVLPLGRRLDVGDSKRYLLAGFAVNLLVFAGFVFVQNPVHIVLVRVLQGLGASLLWVTGSTVVGEIAPEDRRGQWLGSYNQFGSISSLFGDVVGGYLLYAHGFTLTYAVLSGVTLVAFVLVWLYLRDNPGGRKDPAEAGGVETFRTLLRRPMVRALVLFRFAFSVGKMAVIIFLPIYAKTAFGINAFAIGWIMAGGKLTKALTQGYVGDLTDRVGNRFWFVVVGAALYGLGTALIPLAGYLEGTLPLLTLTVAGSLYTFTGPFLVLFGAYSVLGVADSIRLPASMSLFVSEGEGHDAVASSLSLRSISWKVGQVAGPVFVGAVKESVSAEVAFLTAAGFIVVATGVFAVAATVSTERAGPAGAPGD